MDTLTLPIRTTRSGTASATLRRPVPLRRGAILRLDDARGAQLRAASGRVWITEEGRSLDVVLGPGTAHTLAGRGRVVVAAETAARVVIEWSAAARPPRAEVAPAEGAPGTRVTVRERRLAALVGALAAWWRAPGRRRSDDHPAARPSPSDDREHLAPEAVRDRLARQVPLLRA